MIFLPLPRSGELLSSVLTRGGRYFGRAIVRNMSLAHFGERCVCHPQFPKHVPQFAGHWGGPFTTERLIAGNTMYPLTAPFAEPSLRERLLDWMLGNPSGKRRVSGRMLSGTQLETYRFCPACWEEQHRELKNDMGWLREWQIPQCRICLRHGVPLWDTGESFRDRYGASRNLDWSEIDRTKARPLEPLPHDRLLAETAVRLLSRPLDRLPETGQWDAFWRERLAGWENKTLAQKGEAYWGKELLTKLGVTRTDRSLLKGVGRRTWWKYLILLKTLDPEADLLETIDVVCSLPV